MEKENIRLLTKQMGDIVNGSLQSSPSLLGGNIENIYLIRARNGKFIWKISLSGESPIPSRILIKTVEPKRKNMNEIILYKNTPTALKSFLPVIYDVKKQYGFYWILLEELNMLDSPVISIESFRKPIELMASLHAKFYTVKPAIKDKGIAWIPYFLNNAKLSRIRLNRELKKNIKDPLTFKILGKDVPLLKEAIQKSSKIPNLLKSISHSLVHGCFEYHHVGISLRTEEMKIIDWANVSFAPVTLDLVYLIEKSIDHDIDDYEHVSSHRSNCLDCYSKAMKAHNIDIKGSDLRNWYNLVYFSKIIGQFIWEELNKVRKGKDSNYDFYINQLRILTESTN